MAQDYDHTTDELPPLQTKKNHLWLPSDDIQMLGPLKTAMLSSHEALARFQLSPPSLPFANFRSTQAPSRYIFYWLSPSCSW